MKQVAEVKVSLNSDAQAKLKDNLKFDKEELRKHVERALAGNGVLNSEGKGQLPTLEVIVTSIRVRSNFSAVAFGMMAGRDNIQGAVVIRDENGRKLDEFKVSVSYALGGLAGGQDEARMSWMYEEFAKKTIQELLDRKQ